MSDSPSSEPLFQDFPPTSTEDWEARIRHDLKGADYDSEMLWNIADEMTARPYYRREDLERIPHLYSDREALTIDSNWLLQQNVFARSTSEAAEQARLAVAGGVERLGLVIDAVGARPTSERAWNAGSPSNQQGIEIRSVDDLVEVLIPVPLDRVELSVDAGRRTPALLPLLSEALERRGIDSSEYRGTVACDPVSAVVRIGMQDEGVWDEAVAVVASDQLGTSFRRLQCSTDIFHRSGATTVQEAALALAAVSETAVQLAERGISADRAFQQIVMSVSISTSFFLEVAKLRALRLLLPQVADAFVPDGPVFQPPVHVAAPSPAMSNIPAMTNDDAYANLVRSTTSAVAAVIGGCDVLIVHPFDAVSGTPTPLGMRLARNIQHLLRHEANFDRVDDPAAGSYYVEVLTDAVAQRAWEEFKRIEEMGGIMPAIQSGYIQLPRSASQRHQTDLQVPNKKTE